MQIRLLSMAVMMHSKQREIFPVDPRIFIISMCECEAIIGRSTERRDICRLDNIFPLSTLA